VQYRVPGADLQRVDSPDALIIVDSVLPKAGEVPDIRDPQAAGRGAARLPACGGRWPSWRHWAAPASGFISS